MKGSNIRRWGAALAVVIIAGAAYWFWHDSGTVSYTHLRAHETPRHISYA
ncbi:hypothetical protein ACO0SZ_27450, partial [Klebsiella pneumoniae]